MTGMTTASDHILPGDPVLPTGLGHGLRALIWPEGELLGSAALSALQRELEDSRAPRPEHMVSAPYDAPEDNPESWDLARSLDPRPGRRYQSVHLGTEGHPTGWVLGAAGAPGASDTPAPLVTWRAGGETDPDRCPGLNFREATEIDHECCGCGVPSCGGYWGVWQRVRLSSSARRQLAHPLDWETLRGAWQAQTGRTEPSTESGGEPNWNSRPDEYLRGELKANGAALTVWMPAWLSEAPAWPLLERAAGLGLSRAAQLAGEPLDPADYAGLRPLDTAREALSEALLDLSAGVLTGVHRQPWGERTPQGHRGARHPDRVGGERLEAACGDYLGWQARHWNH